MLVDDDTQTKMDVNETTENFTQRSHFDGSNTHHRIYKLHKTVNKTTGCLWNLRPSLKSSNHYPFMYQGLYHLFLQFYHENHDTPQESKPTYLLPMYTIHTSSW